MSFPYLHPNILKTLIKDYLPNWNDDPYSQSDKNTPGLNKFTVGIFLYAAFALALVEYLGQPSKFLKYANNHKNVISNFFIQYFYESEFANLHQLIWWIAIIGLFYFLIPLIGIGVLRGKSHDHFGLQIGISLKDYRLYLGIIVLMLPLVYLGSRNPAFQKTYPFYTPEKGNLFPMLFYWECIYFLQFVFVEFFFRGFLIHGLKKNLGFSVIFISMIPYTAIHFGKPLGETLGAIPAGLVLGAISLKTRSIYPGIAIHYTIGLTMDLFALWQKGYF